MVKIALFLAVAAVIVAALQFSKRRKPELFVVISVFQWLLPAVVLMLAGMYTLLLLLNMSEGVFERYRYIATEVVQSAFTEEYPEELRRNFDGVKRLNMDFCTPQQLREWERGRYPLCSIAKSSVYGCFFNWIPRHCGAIRTTPEIWSNNRIRNLIELAARNPCHYMPKPTNPRQGYYEWTAAKCDDVAPSQRFDVAIFLGDGPPQDARRRVATFSRPWWWAKDVWDEFTHW